VDKEKKGKAGAPRGNRNAAKVGEDLRLELYLSKIRRGFLEEWYELRFGVRPTEDQLRESVRQFANKAIDRAILEEFEHHHPGRTVPSGEVF
jgi:hypothetical protein